MDEKAFVVTLTGEELTYLSRVLIQVGENYHDLERKPPPVWLRVANKVSDAGMLQ